METWGQWLRNSTDKFLLLFLVLFLIGMTIHMLHDQKDADSVLWMREQVNTVIGALLGLITGHALASRASATTIPGGATTTKTETAAE